MVLRMVTFAMRNLGVDRSNPLKDFDFGSAVNSAHPDYANDIKRDHFDLGTCLHYILSGIYPFTAACSYAEAEEVRAKLTGGHSTIGRGAEVLAGIIEDCWTGRASSEPFGQLSRRASDILGPLADSNPSPYPEGHY